MAHNITGCYALFYCMAPAEFSPIALKLRPRLMALGLSFFGDEEAAEDAAQEALLRLWTAWQGLPAEEDAERLAVRLTKHACIDAKRRMHTELLVPMANKTTKTEASQTTAADMLQEREMREAVVQAVSHLRPSERRLWTMFAEAQMETTQIAAATGIDVRTVSAMLSSARRKIKNELKKGGWL